ncbi:hypothetical protein J6590_063378 [Homalodisca vitripennis]|nr:hypothetical protein J6590_063378 [Homalodisca vitripennis]
MPQTLGQRCTAPVLMLPPPSLSAGFAHLHTFLHKLVAAVCRCRSKAYKFQLIIMLLVKYNGIRLSKQLIPAYYGLIYPHRSFGMVQWEACASSHFLRVFWLQKKGDSRYRQVELQRVTGRHRTAGPTTKTSKTRMRRFLASNAFYSASPRFNETNSSLLLISLLTDPSANNRDIAGGRVQFDFYCNTDEYLTQVSYDWTITTSEVLYRKINRFLFLTARAFLYVLKVGTNKEDFGFLPLKINRVFHGPRRIKFQVSRPSLSRVLGFLNYQSSVRVFWPRSPVKKHLTRH